MANSTYINDPGDVDRDAFGRAFKARLEITKLLGEKLVKEYRHDTAKTLLMAGLNLIPSDHLNDNQFVVSRGVYEAALRIVKEEER